MIVCIWHFHLIHGEHKLSYAHALCLNQLTIVVLLILTRKLIVNTSGFYDHDSYLIRLLNSIKHVLMVFRSAGYINDEVRFMVLIAKSHPVDVNGMTCLSVYLNLIEDPSIFVGQLVKATIFKLVCDLLLIHDQLFFVDIATLVN